MSALNKRVADLLAEHRRIKEEQKALRGRMLEVAVEHLGIDQREAVFWSAVGIGQSAGSRYESGRNIPRPVQMLLRIAYGTRAQSAKQVDALRPGAAQEAAE